MDSLLSGTPSRTRRHHAFRTAVRLGTVIALVLGLVSCSGEAADTTVTSIVVASTADTDLSEPSLPAGCVPSEPRPGIDLQFEEIIQAYNDRDRDRMVSVIGDGRIRDLSLEPRTAGVYPSVAAWLAAAEAVDDQLSATGYSFDEPFGIYLVRRNPTLREVGIDELNVTLNLWVNQDCDLRVDSSAELISSPDPCRYADLYQDEDTPDGCRGPFEPRAGHVAVWTGTEVLISGGTSGSQVSPPLETGLAFDPNLGSWRELSPTPETLPWWPTMRAVWASDRMIVAGLVVRGGEPAIVLLSYFPADDAWSTSAPVPGDREAVGGLVWTGTEVILAGGDSHYPDSTAWAYNPTSGQWRQLPDPPISDVEGIVGVWTGTEAIFFGGYGGITSAAAAYLPGTNSWRPISNPPLAWIQGHQLIWTGDRVIVFSGHTGPGHLTHLLLYDPTSDTWTKSSELPIPPAERLGGAWTGDQLIIWGGYATYGDREGGDVVHGYGAAYDPETDTWTVLPEAPIADRCDHSVTWTGSELLVFGGMTTCGDPNVLAVGDAAAYDPETDTWRVVSRP